MRWISGQLREGNDVADRAGEYGAAGLDKPPAHRPSRRHVIIDAAIRVFARKGYADASIQDVAEQAHVVPTAVYYHFSGKDELFDVALRRVMAETDDLVRSVRPDDEAADAGALGRVIAAVWDWTEEHPDEAKL